MTGFIAPGSDEWRQTISASKVPAILGLSPWTSARELYHVMVGDIPTQPGNAATSRGNYLEPAILAWFRDQHPDTDHGDTYTAHHPDHPEWTCTPDGTADADLVEAKSVGDDYDWGKQGTAEIPPYYLAQAAWQMIVTRSRRVWFPIITGRLVFKEYIVNWEDVEADVPIILGYVNDFQRRIRELDPPDWDGSDSTYRTVKALHPLLTDDEATVSHAVAYEYGASITGLEEAEQRAIKAKAAVIEAAPTARKIHAPDGTQIAYRSGGPGKIPSLTKTAGAEKYAAAAQTHQLAS